MMPLKVTLDANEQIIVNGCAIRNAGRRSAFMIESHADVVRGRDLITAAEATTPVTRAYFLIQTALTEIKRREELLKPIQHSLAELATVFGGPNLAHIFEAANFVSQGDLYKALRELRQVRRHEAALLSRITTRDALAGTEDALAS